MPQYLESLCPLVAPSLCLGVTAQGYQDSKYHRSLGLGVYRIAGNFHIVQNFAVFADRSAAARNKNHKIFHLYLVLTMDYWWVWSHQSASAKLKTTKFSSEGLGGNSAKFCTSENFPLYGIYYLSMLYLSPIVQLNCSSH